LPYVTRVFQISVQIQPGNSGGPIFDQSGNVIGIAQASLDPQLATESIGTIPQNVNYAIKSTYIKKLFQCCQKHWLAIEVL
jgi:S1-C subfamily serine protease